MITGGICAVVVTRNNEYIISGSEDNSIKVHSLLNKKEIMSFNKIYRGKECKNSCLKQY